MLVYEKNNKLNISFENNVENPDFEISKEEVNIGSANIVSSGSGSGANVLTLYVSEENTKEFAGENCVLAYKDFEMTQAYSSYEEAFTAVTNASTVRVMFPKASYDDVNNLTHMFIEYVSNVDCIADSQNSMYVVGVQTGHNDTYCLYADSKPSLTSLK